MVTDEQQGGRQAKHSLTGVKKAGALLRSSPQRAKSVATLLRAATTLRALPTGFAWLLPAALALALALLLARARACLACRCCAPATHAAPAAAAARAALHCCCFAAALRRCSARCLPRTRARKKHGAQTRSLLAAPLHATCTRAPRRARARFCCAACRAHLHAYAFRFAFALRFTPPAATAHAARSWRRRLSFSSLPAAHGTLVLGCRMEDRMVAAPAYASVNAGVRGRQAARTISIKLYCRLSLLSRAAAPAWRLCVAA